MPRWASIAIFFSMMIGITGGLHYFFWARLVRDTALPAGWTRLGTLAITGFALAMPLSAALYTGMTISSALRHHRGAGAAWKGRSYSDVQRAPDVASLQ